MSDTKQFEIDPSDDLSDVEPVLVKEGDGGEPLEFYDHTDPDIFHPLALDDDLMESADVAVQATIAALDEEADAFEYGAAEADEVLALTVGQLIAQAANNAMFDAQGDPMAAAHAVLHVLLAAQEAVTEQHGAEAFPVLCIDGDAIIADAR